MNSTHYTNKCSILAELWLNYRSDPDFQDFTEYNDLGLPLAYAIDSNIVKSTEMAQRFVEETFDLLLASLKVEDVSFDNLDELLNVAENPNEN
jgi:hypothetical protein